MQMQDNNGAAEKAKVVIPRGIHAGGLSRELPNPKLSRKPDVIVALRSHGLGFLVN